MAVTHGADVAELRALARQMQVTGQRLVGAEKGITSAMRAADWEGTDADGFKSMWNGTLRTSLLRASQTLDGQSTVLKLHADDQERASAADGAGTGGTAGGGADGETARRDGGMQPKDIQKAGEKDEREWSDAFTDPNYEHAPTGLEWLLDRFGEGWADNIPLFKWAADKLAWNFDFVEKGVDDLVDKIKVGGKVLGIVGGALGVGDVITGIAYKDPFRAADGAIGAGLSIAALAATGTILGAPAGAVLGGVALVWGVATMISGDVPVTKRIYDFGASVVGGVTDAYDTVSEDVSDVVDASKKFFGGVADAFGF